MHQGTKRSYRDIDSPIGSLRLVGSGDSLHYLVILKAQQLRDNVGEWIEESSGFGSIVDQLDAYFNNQTKYFSIPTILIGTDFQKQVWEELQKIPFGETRTYAEVALSIGRPKAVRAVGTAIGANPIPVIVPCFTFNEQLDTAANPPKYFDKFFISKILSCITELDHNLL